VAKGSHDAMTGIGTVRKQISILLPAWNKLWLQMVEA
jgi:hypothetical protein